MSTVNLVLLLASIFFALNMGISGFSVAFAPSYGSRILKKNKAVLLYGLFVFIGAVAIGPRVVATLAGKISLHQLSPLSGFLILFAAGTAMFMSNLLRIPQSTSFVTVASFLGAGLFYRQVNWHTVMKILITAVIFSACSFILTLLIKRRIYPPKQKNLMFYEKFHIHRNNIKRFVVWTGIYSAFGIGTNNVANVVAPIAGSLSISPLLALALGAPLFAVGAHIFGKRVMHTVSQDIVPIGEISAAIISFMTATFVIAASLLGLPTPYVQFTTFSVLAISCVKDGLKPTLAKSVFQRIVSVWILMPVITVFLSLFLHVIFITR